MSAKKIDRDEARAIAMRVVPLLVAVVVMLIPPITGAEVRGVMRRLREVLAEVERSLLD